MTESERVSRFEAAYNRIDHALTDAISHMGNRRKFGFSAKVRILASRRKRLARHADALLDMAELRNAVVHGHTGEDTYMAVPSEQTVLELEEIERDVFSPEKVMPKFQRSVTTVRADQSLADVWKLVKDEGFSRFPVYDSHGFVGLLTSNGFARWCAAQLNGSRLDVDTAQAKVADVLEKDHRREAVQFVSRDALIDDVEDLFAQVQPLEAVIITEHGRREERPIGMVCAMDIAGQRNHSNNHH
ncbi:MAG TPA: CBS domain-containing protein [Phycisphaerales bacterium]|nr:CBS domain-containing protein [Phycisphaerales bacterium]